jgi:hypothetical protein
MYNWYGDCFLDRKLGISLACNCYARKVITVGLRRIQSDQMRKCRDSPGGEVTKWSKRDT